MSTTTTDPNILLQEAAAESREFWTDDQIAEAIAPALEQRPAARAREFYERQAKERQKGGQGGKLLPANLPEAKGDARDQAGKAVGVPPNDPEAERGLIGATIIDPSVYTRLDPAIRPVDFHDTRHTAIWAAIQGLVSDGVAVDLVMLGDRLTKSGRLADAGGIDYLAGLVSGGYLAAHAPHYAEIIKRDSERRRLIEVGHEIVRQAMQPHAEPAAIIEDAKATLGTSTRGGCIDYQAIRAADLLSQRYALDYLVPGVLVDGQPCLMAGAQKTLKTSLLVDLLVSVVSGRPFLGYFRPERCVRAALMTGESGLATIQETLLRIMQAAGIDAGYLNGLLVTDKLPRFGQVDHLEAMRRFIADNELGLVAVDPAYMTMAGTDSGNLFCQGELLAGMTGVFQEAGATLILVHHTKKNLGRDAYGPPELQDAAWSGFAEWARQWLLIARREQYQPGTGEHRLWLSAGGSAGHNGLWALNVNEGTRDDPGGRRWDVTVHHASDAIDDAKQRHEQAKHSAATQKAQERLEQDRGDIVQAMVRMGTPDTKNAIRDRTACGHRRFDAAFASLVSDGTVKPAEITKANGQKYAGWAVSEVSP